MKKFALLCLLQGCLAFLATAQTPEKFARVRINLNGQDLSRLTALGIETDHGTWTPGRSLITVLAASELQEVRAAGFATEVLVDDLQAWHRAQAAEYAAAQPRNHLCSDFDVNPYPTPANYTYGSMAGYYTYQEMLDILDDMAAKFPQLISVRAVVSDTLLTHEGRPQWWVRVSDHAGTDENEPEVLYTALHHAREPNSLSQMIFYLWYLLEHYATDPEIQYIVDNAELYFIPCINPDGYLYNEFTNPDGYGYWRKNRRDNGDGSFGVDLNRNYGYEWGYNNSGSSPNPSSETYRGPAGFSEPETQMVRDFCLQHNFVLTFNYHTFSNLLIYPWGYSDELAEPGLAELAQLFTRENHYKAGVSTQTVGYPVNGTSDDWMYATKGTYSYTPEVGPGTYGFWPPIEAIDGLNRENMWQNLSMALCALRFGELKDLSPYSFTETDAISIPFSLRRYGFQDGPLTVSLTPLTANVQSVSPAQVFNLAQLESVEDSFTVVLAPTALPGQQLLFLLSLDNGTYSHTDTLRKVLEGSTQVLWSDAANDLTSWGTSGWGLTTETFVSAPTSFTDSPNALYFPNSNNTLLLTTPVFIPANAINPQLRFSARWEIEDLFDFLVVQGAGNDGNYSPLCGKYTTPGSDYQLSGAPLYDGFQPEWVEESMSLAAYAGQDLSLEFNLLSNDAGEYDGFYLDDLRIEYFDPATSSTMSVTPTDLRLQSQPNPATDRTLLRWDNPTQRGGDAQLLVFNVLGEPVWIAPVNLSRQNQAWLEVKEWPNGLYFFQLQGAGWHSAQGKLVVGH